MTGQHRHPRRSPARRGVGAALTLALVAAAGAGGWYGYRHDMLPFARHCGSSAALSVAAAPEIAPALRGAASAWNAKQNTIDGTCVRVAVQSQAPSAVAAAIAGAHGQTISGLGKPNGATRVPDVWVPDSSTWLSRLALAGGTGGTQGPAAALVAKGTSVAMSPVVIAMPQPVASALGASTKGVSWEGLISKLTSGSVRTGVVDPNVDASGLGALLGVGIATGAGTTAGPASGSGSASGGTAGSAAAALTGTSRANAEALTVAAIRALASGDSLVRDDLMGQFPRATDQSTISRSLAAAPVPEQAVLAYNAAKPPVPLVSVYLNPAPPALDYPFTPLAGVSTVKSDAAASFAATLQGDGWRNRLAKVSLRAANGTYGAGMQQTDGMPAGPLAPPAGLPAAAVDQALSTWSAVTVPGRMLAVVDVSGSMATHVPAANGATREAVTVSAARAGLGLMDDKWNVGLWTFATDLSNHKAYQQLVPIEPLAQNRSGMSRALGTVKPLPNGATGLYDTVLAAYKQVQAGWDPSRVNSVVIMTDGQNDNPGGLTMTRLLGQLHAAADPARPVEVIAIGIGSGVDKAELSKITAATGGGVFLASDPTMIGDIFLKAIALRPGAAK